MPRRQAMDVGVPRRATPEQNVSVCHTRQSGTDWSTAAAHLGYCGSIATSKTPKEGTGRHAATSPPARPSSPGTYLALVAFQNGRDGQRRGRPGQQLQERHGCIKAGGRQRTATTTKQPMGSAPGRRGVGEKRSRQEKPRHWKHQKKKRQKVSSWYPWSGCTHAAGRADIRNPHVRPSTCQQPPLATHPASSTPQRTAHRGSTPHTAPFAGTRHSQRLTSRSSPRRRRRRRRGRPPPRPPFALL